MALCMKPPRRAPPFFNAAPTTAPIGGFTVGTVLNPTARVITRCDFAGGSDSILQGPPGVGPGGGVGERIGGGATNIGCIGGSGLGPGPQGPGVRIGSITGLMIGGGGFKTGGLTLFLMAFILLLGPSGVPLATSGWNPAPLYLDKFGSTGPPRKAAVLDETWLRGIGTEFDARFPLRVIELTREETSPPLAGLAVAAFATALFVIPAALTESAAATLADEVAAFAVLAAAGVLAALAATALAAFVGGATGGGLV